MKLGFGKIAILVLLPLIGVAALVMAFREYSRKYEHDAGNSMIAVITIDGPFQEALEAEDAWTMKQRLGVVLDNMTTLHIDYPTAREKLTRVIERLSILEGLDRASPLYQPQLSLIRKDLESIPHPAGEYYNQHVPSGFSAQSSGLLVIGLFALIHSVSLLRRWTRPRPAMASGLPTTAA